MDQLTQTILQPATETERRAALIQLWKNVQQGATIPADLHDFIQHHHTRDWVQSAVIGLLLWKLEGSTTPAPPHILVRVFPGLFDDEDDAIVQESAQALFGDLRAAEFFRQTSQRNLADEEKDADEAWYAMRILSNYTAEISEAYDKRQRRTGNL